MQRGSYRAEKARSSKEVIAGTRCGRGSASELGRMLLRDAQQNLQHKRGGEIGERPQSTVKKKTCGLVVITQGKPLSPLETSVTI